MKNVSFDYLFESDIAKIVKKKGASNAIKIETLKRMVKLIIKKELNKRQRTILELYFVRNLKYFQIAQILNISKSTVSKKKKKALKYYEFT